jgi:quercetin dioxygenase-like cupin family protein
MMAQESVSKPVIGKVSAAKPITFPNIPDCATGVVERGDPSNSPSVIFAKFESGCAVPWHWHTPNEQLMIVGGILQLQVKDERKPVLLSRGDYGFMPSHHIHQARCLSSAPCQFFLSADATFDIHYVDAAGKEIPTDEALKGANKAAQPSKHR